MFQPDTVVADALAAHPNVRWVFAAWHLGGCSHCDRAPDETLRQLAEGYGIPLDSFLHDLNTLVAN